MRIELGLTVRDKISGFQGVAMGRTEYLTGCAHIGVAPRQLKSDGTIHEWQWLDETRLDVVESEKKILIGKSKDAEDKGGPCPNAPEM